MMSDGLFLTESKDKNKEKIKKIKNEKLVAGTTDQDL